MAGDANYQFLPWYRTGLATAIAGMAGNRGQATLEIITRVGNAANTVPHELNLIGPGDIIGIDARAVVRVDPRPGNNDFEPNYVACIEFFDEDFAWRYSPQAAAGDKLLPWIALIVIEDRKEGMIADQGPDLPRKVHIDNAAVLPPADQMWAWAHTHLNEEPPGHPDPEKTAAWLRAHPNRGCCRILSPRRLKPLRAYRAILTPVFEAGRLAGLIDKTTDGRQLAWPAAGPVDLPVYYEWTFGAGPDGDFEKLAERLVAKPPENNVGRRPLNMSRPLAAPGVPKILEEPQGGNPARPLLQLEGAVKVPGAQPSSWEENSRKQFQSWLGAFINLGEAWTLNAGAVQGAPVLPDGIKLPVVLPPSYGRWHANTPLLDSNFALKRWLEQLNLDPRNRVAAAFGTQVIQRHQEDLMARSWRQYGELFAANQQQARGQFYREILLSMETKHLKPLDETRFLAVTNLSHARVLQDGPSRVTVQGAIEKSALLPAAVQPSARRTLRAHGAVAKRFGRAAPHLDNLVADLASRRIEAAPDLAQPAVRATLASGPRPTGSPAGPTWIGDDWEAVRPRLEEYLDHTIQTERILPEVRIVEPVVREALSRGDARGIFSATGLTPMDVRDVRAAVDYFPPIERRPRHEDLERSRLDGNFSFVAYNTRQALLNSMILLTSEVPERIPAPALDLRQVTATVRGKLSPLVTVSDRIGRMIALPERVKLPKYDPLERIMAHPVFDEPTYEYLRELSDDHVIPNLSLIANNTITLLAVNWRFIESYLVGLNHEMARELLWRRFPTDRRGSYFRHFWDIRGIPGAIDGSGKIVELFRDIHPVHGWIRDQELTPLGENRPVGRQIEENLVLVIRGDLIRRYPNVEVFAVKAVRNAEHLPDKFQFSRRKPGTKTERPRFEAQFGRDVRCYGFNLTKEQAIGTSIDEGDELGWYFVLSERFGEPRFGLDEPENPAADFGRQPTIEEFSWAHLANGATPQTNEAIYRDLASVDFRVHKPNVPAAGFPTVAGRTAKWNNDSAGMAAIFLQLPYRLYFHASKMLREPAQ